MYKTSSVLLCIKPKLTCQHLGVVSYRKPLSGIVKYYSSTSIIPSLHNININCNDPMCKINMMVLPNRGPLLPTPIKHTF